MRSIVQGQCGAQWGHTRWFRVTLCIVQGQLQQVTEQREALHRVRSATEAGHHGGGPHRAVGGMWTAMKLTT